MPHRNMLDGGMVLVMRQRTLCTRGSVANLPLCAPWNGS